MSKINIVAELIEKAYKEPVCILEKPSPGKAWIFEIINGELVAIQIDSPKIPVTLIHSSGLISMGFLK